VSQFPSNSICSFPLICPWLYVTDNLANPELLAGNPNWPWGLQSGHSQPFPCLSVSSCVILVLACCAPTTLVFPL
jgi:hypothetical protein